MSIANLRISETLDTELDASLRGIFKDVPDRALRAEDPVSRLTPLEKTNVRLDANTIKTAKLPKAAPGTSDGAVHECRQLYHQYHLSSNQERELASGLGVGKARRFRSIVSCNGFLPLAPDSHVQARSGAALLISMYEL